MVALLVGSEKEGDDRIESAGDSPEGMLRELMSHSPEQRVMLVENSERFRSVELCELALKRGFELGLEDPPEAESMISLAVAIADSFQLADLAQETVFDIRARAYAHLGNTRRIRSDLVGSEVAFDRARMNWSAGSRDPRVEAIICDLEAALLSERREFDSAMDLLERAIQRFEVEGDRHLVGRTWLSKAFVLGAKGDFHEAIEALEEGISLVEPEAEPRLALLAKHNLLVFLREEGRLGEIEDLLPDTRMTHSRLGNSVDLMRFKWLEGQIAVDSDRWSEAEGLFVEVKQFFVEKGMAHDVALVSLDLAHVYLRQDRIAELKSLAAEMLTIFRAHRVHQDTLAALAFCRKALEVEKLTVGLVSELAACLETARERARFGVGLSVAE